MANASHQRAYLLIPHPTEPRLLLLPQGDDRWTLPLLVIPDPEPLVAKSSAFINEARRFWGLHLEVMTYWSGDDPSAPVYVTDNLTPAATAPGGGRWFGREDRDELARIEPGQRPVLQRWFAEIQDGDLPAGEPPWKQVRWSRRSSAWIRAEVERLNFGSGARVEMWKEWDCSCVRRVVTKAGHLYFKAVAPVFDHEPPVTRLLSEQCLEHVPKVLAVSPADSWMLLGEVDGTLLHRLPPREWPIEQIATGYARLQRALCGEADSLRDLGCPERTLNQLAAQIAPAVAELPTLMAAKPDVLSPAQLDELQALVPELEKRCRELAGFRVPLSLDHGDLQSSNVLITAKGPVFLDWSHSSLTHPFFSTRLLAESLCYEPNPDAFVLLARLRDAYLEPWTDCEPLARLRRAFRIAQRVAPVHEALIYHRAYYSPSVQRKEWCVDLACWFWRMLLRPFGTTDPI